MNPPPSHDPDYDHISACRKGDVDAFEILVKKHQEQMFNTAFHMIGSYEDAGEVVQDAFVSAFKNIKKFKHYSKFTTWLTQIVVNMSKNRINKVATQRKKTPVSLDAPLKIEDGEIKRDPASEIPSAEKRMELKQIRQQVQRCIEKIDISFRDVLVLKDIQGFAYSEIGTMLQIPQGTVKSKLFRARDSLKNCLKKAIGDLSHVMS